MNICILGAGMQGRTIAQDLYKHGHKLTILDSSKLNIEIVNKQCKAETKIFDVSNKNALINFIRNFNIIVCALPAALGFYVMQCAIEAGVNIVDLSYAPENPFILDNIAKERKIKIIADAGFAPGLSNILAGEAYRELGGLDSLKIMVGGIPQNPIPPFNYNITWSISDLLEEYTRPAKIIKNFQIITQDALTGLEEFTIPNIGKLECFYTDGLRTLVETFKKVKNMEEKTIRYPGHANLFKVLIECGFLSDDTINLKNSSFTAKEFTMEFLKTYLSKQNEKDLSILIIEAKNNNMTKKYLSIDYFDEKNMTTSMTRMTGYTCSIITQCAMNYPGYGVIAPEHLGMNKNICDFIKTELTKRNIIIKIM
jgi:saccharopine dehydrogenase-like NADP-dependent oxidoreductase